MTTMEHNTFTHVLDGTEQQMLATLRQRTAYGEALIEAQQIITDLLCMPDFDSTRETSEIRRDTKRRAIAWLAMMKGEQA